MADQRGVDVGKGTGDGYVGCHQTLNDARYHLDRAAGASDFDTYRREFLACVTALRAVGHILETEGRRSARAHAKQTGENSVVDFNSWWDAKRRLQLQDPLLRTIKTVRDSHLKEGVSPLGRQHVSLQIQSYDSQGQLVGTSPSLILAWLTDPPDIHLEQLIESSDPSSLCELALGWYERVVGEAEERWPRQI